jgi:PAS domain S-box-containing protein
LKRDGSYYPVRVTVLPVQEPKAPEGLLVVTFEGETPVPPGLPHVTPAGGGEADDETTLRQVENELRATREELQSAIEGRNSSDAKLMALNEELVTANEELQLANEVLRTSQEELQSLNEELGAVNSQLQDKVGELEKANNNMANLLNCTDVATVFLDAGQRIQLFTPSTTRMFNLIAADLGRPLRDIAPKVTDPDCQRDAEEVLRDLAPREAEVRTEDGHWYIRRIMPYRTRDHRIEGVVVIFVDITDRKQKEVAVRRLAAVVESSADAIFSKDIDGTIRTWNRGAERLFGYTPDEAVGRPVRMLVPEDRAEEWDQVMSLLARGEHVEQLETERLRKDGGRVAVALTVSPIRDGGGEVVSASVIARDVGERKQAEQALRNREERLQAILNTVVDAIITIDRRGIIQAVNPATERMFGYAAAEMVGQSVNMLMPSPYREEHDDYLERYARTGEKHIIGISREVDARRKDGSVFPTDLAVSEIEDLGLFTGIHRDLTERKQLERDVVEAASLEQRRIGQDLHDSVAQELTALSLLAGDLAETLRGGPAKTAQLVGRVEQGLQRSQQELRAVLCGLLPVAVDSAGLMAALSDLADRTRQEGKLTCTFDCPEPVSVADNLAATQLYFIAQEAVRNAVKHARAGNVRIGLSAAEAGLVLRVRDDGVGMPAGPAGYQGLGLRIMGHRAAILGARLTIEPGRPTGTLVTCALAGKSHEQEKKPTTGPGADRR